MQPKLQPGLRRFGRRPRTARRLDAPTLERRTTQSERLLSWGCCHARRTLMLQTSVSCSLARIWSSRLTTAAIWRWRSMSGFPRRLRAPRSSAGRHASCSSLHRDSHPARSSEPGRPPGSRRRCHAPGVLPFRRPDLQVLRLRRPGPEARCPGIRAGSWGLVVPRAPALAGHPLRRTQAARPRPASVPFALLVP